MPDITIPNDGGVTVPLAFTDQLGRTIAEPAGISVESSDTNVATATLSESGNAVVTAVGNGEASVSAAAPGIAIEALNVTVSNPVAVKGAFEVSQATFFARI